MNVKRPKVMGILNVTPDSFSDGGHYSTLTQAVARAFALIDEGADMLDIGGESTRPGAPYVSSEDEIVRTVPVISAIREKARELESDITLSIDTRKPDVAEAAILAGADIWNDVTALTYHERSLAVAADLGCPVILMHMQGTPKTMQAAPRYDNVVGEVSTYLAARARAAQAAGVEHIILDPGIGFGKTLADNLALLANVSEFKSLGYPLLLGTSRKSFIGKIDGSSVDRRLGGSLASALYGAQSGVDILRVHDVFETVQALKVWEDIDNEI